MSILRTEELTKIFHGKRAVNAVNTSYEQGFVYGLLGPNGSGKSTYMKMIAGLVHPSHGKILLNEEPITNKSKSDIAYMTTEPFIYSHLTVKQVGQFFNDFFEDFVMVDYEALIDYMELDMKMRVSDLSSGMNSKLKIAATMSRNAKVLMLDEPLNGIDVIAREKILKSIANRRHQYNTLIISSHLVDLMEPYIDHVIFLKNGVVAMDAHLNTLKMETQKNLTDLYKEVYTHVKTDEIRMDS